MQIVAKYSYQLYSRLSMELAEKLTVYVERALMVLTMLAYIYFGLMVLNFIVYVVSGHGFDFSIFFNRVHNSNSATIEAPQIPVKGSQPVIVATSTPVL